MVGGLRVLGALLVAVLPWRLKRLVYVYVFKWEVSPGARVDCSVIRCPKVILRDGAHIGHLNLIRNCEVVELDEHAIIGSMNWVNGRLLARKDLYTLETNRRPELHMGRHSSVTMMHMIDCTDLVTIGAYAVVAGSQSTIYTHSPDLERARIGCAPVALGDYTFVGTDCTILPGAELPDYAVLGARSLLRSKLEKSYALYGGVPAVWIKALAPTLGYFVREDGTLRVGG